MKRFLSFTLGLIFGIVFLLGTFGLAMYTSVTAVHPNEIYSDLEKYLGDLGDVSLLQAYYNILDLYKAQTGGLTEGDLYSVGDFLADNHISTTDEETGDVTAFGIVMPKELLNAPLFEYFNTNQDEKGHTGVQRALKQIKLSAVPAVVNMFATGEGDNKIISDDVTTELDNYSVYYLLYGEDKTDGEETDIVANLAAITQNIKLVHLIPSLHVEGETENALAKLLSAVGEASIGGLITDLTGDNNIFGMFNAGGSLSAVGELTFTDLLGSTDPLISSMLGSVSLADFIADNGNFNIQQAMDKISIAGLFGLIKREMAIDLTDTTITVSNFTNTDEGEPVVELSVATKVDGEQTIYYLSTDGKTWYEGQLVCEDTKHTHTKDCYDYLWYIACKKEEHTHTDDCTADCETTEHSHDGEYVVGEKSYIPVDKTSIYRTIANLKLSALLEDGAINFENLFKKFDNHKLDEIIKELLADNDSLIKLCDLLKLDEMTLSQLLGEGGFDQLFANVTNVPIKDIFETFGVTGLEFITDMVGDMSINELANGGFDNISLGSLLGLVKRETSVDLTDTTITVRRFTTTDDDGETVVELSVATKVEGEQTVYYLSTDSETWYNGKFTCKLEEHVHVDSCDTDCDKEHTHGFDCYDYIWYQECKDDCGHDASEHTTIGDKNYTEATGMFGAFAGLTIGDLTGGGDIMSTLLDKLTLGDVMQSNLPDMLDSLKDTPISQLSGAIETTKAGNLLGFQRKEVNLSEGDWTKSSIGGLHQHTDGRWAKADGDKYYLAEFTCSTEEHVHATECGTEGSYTCGKEEHTHAAECYSYIWYGEDGATPLTGIEKVLADKTINDLRDFGTILNDVTLGDVMGEDKLPDMLKSLKDVKIGELSTEITKTKVGNLLEFTYDEEGGCWKKEDGTGALVEVTGIEKVLADKTINDLKDLNTIMDDVTLGDVMQDNIPDMLKSLKDVKIGELGTKMNEMHVGELLGYKKDGDIWYKECEGTDCGHTHDDIDGKNNYVETTGIEKVLADKTINDLKDLNTIMDDVTLGDVMQDNIPDMLKSLENVKIADLGTKMNEMYVGEMLKYTRTLTCTNEDHTHTDDCYKWDNEGVEVTGMMAKIANKKVGNLGTIGEDIQSYTIVDILGKKNGDSALIKALYDTPVGDIGSTMDKIQLGTAMGYYSELDCTESHEHGKDCYKWYTDESLTTPVTAPQSAFVNYTLSGIGAGISEIKLGELVDVESGSPMLKALKDTPIDGIGNAINTMALGTSMGFVRREIDITTGYTTINSTITAVKTNGTTIVKELDGKWYEAVLSCKDTTSGHSHDESCYDFVWYEKCTEGCAEHTTHIKIDGAKHVKVTGLNAKMANLTVQTMGGNAFVEIVNGLSMRDLIDSGVLTFDDDQLFKLAIMYGCSDTSHCITETSIIGTTTYKCNIGDYLLYKTSHTSETVSAKDFYKKCHSIATESLTDEQLAHRDQWQDCTLNDFITNLLNGI